MTAVQVQAKDYIGMWYLARARHGIDDRIRFGVINPDAGEVEWHSLPHSRFDGLGGVAHLLRGRGLQVGPLPGRGEATGPSPLQLLRALCRRGPAPLSEPDWQPGEGADVTTPVIAVDWASRVETDMIRRNARELGISVTVLLFWALHQVVAEHLMRQGTVGSWMFPVNMRGPVRLPDDEMNHSSGFYLPVDADWTPMELRARIVEAMKAGRHWAMWYLARIGRLVGQPGVNWLYDTMVSARGHLGSFTALGEWHEDLGRAGWPDHALMCCCAPGSPTHPVSNGAMIWNGRLTLVLQFHPVLGHHKAMVERCLHDWRALLLDPGAMEAVA